MVSFYWTERITKLALLGLNAVLIVAFGLNVMKVSQLEYEPPVESGDAAALSPEPAAVPKYTFPSGNRTLLPEYRLIALYGSPGIPALGALGAQNAEASIARIKSIAAEYQAHSAEPFMPALEIIATIASSGATENGDYSQEVSLATLQPWIDAAKAANVYVILDLQPGRSDFLTQAKIYEAFLREPHVGLALDPEWRIKPNQVHLKQIGTVDAAEVNQVSAWMADLVKAHDLPQKLLLLHQFKLSMITNRESLDTSRAELAYMLQMDGQGKPSVKQDTWRVLLQNPPANVYFGWKNFYVKDTPMLNAEQTMAVEPKPWYISFQ